MTGVEKGEVRGGEGRERLSTGPWRTVIFKERESNHKKPMKKTKKDQSKIRRDMRRGWGSCESRRVLKRRQWPALWCELDLAVRSLTALV